MTKSKSKSVVDKFAGLVQDYRISRTNGIRNEEAINATAELLNLPAEDAEKLLAGKVKVITEGSSIKYNLDKDQQELFSESEQSEAAEAVNE